LRLIARHNPQGILAIPAINLAKFFRPILGLLRPKKTTFP